ncbi:MAG: uncharacterized protein JWQ27_138 [Ferruginibacter sp.]|nr:uncharacterized protein [Ferruginibacter sp.]
MIVFTLCSNNYLAQAKTLGDSFLLHNPGATFAIGLVDRRHEAIDYSIFSNFLLLPVEEIGIKPFEEMRARYSVMELNTAVKPFYFHYFYQHYPQENKVIYLDPDILVYQPLNVLSEKLEENNIVLTPHFTTPIYDDYNPGEPNILNTGIYNLGFIGTSRSEETMKFLDWWMVKLTTQCINSFFDGLFVDQLWNNFTPLYFEKVHILRHKGHNVAYWNLHERRITGDTPEYTVNDEVPLVFYHFSGFLFNNTAEISKYQDRFTFAQRPDIVPLFKDYAHIVMKNGHEKFAAIKCYFDQGKPPSKLLKAMKNPALGNMINRFLEKKLHLRLIKTR